MAIYSDHQEHLVSVWNMLIARLIPRSLVTVHADESGLVSLGVVEIAFRAMEA